MFHNNAQILAGSRKRTAMSRLVLYEPPAPDVPTHYSSAHICAAWAHQTCSLPAKMSSTISNLAPSTYAWVGKTHFSSAVLTMGLMWMQELALKCPHTSLTLYNCEVALYVGQQYNPTEVKSALGSVGTGRLAFYPTEEASQRGLETSSSSALRSSVRPRHPVTSDFILEAPLGDK